MSFANLYECFDHTYHALSSRSRADLSRKLGWKPTRTRGDFFESFKEEVKTVAAETN